jgi:hypothetical protein
MKICLLIASLTSVLGACVCIGYGLSLMINHSGGAGALLILLGTPSAFALAIVFNYVRERLDEDQPECVNDRLSETTGTPWENDQEHTTGK